MIYRTLRKTELPTVRCLQQRPKVCNPKINLEQYSTFCHAHQIKHLKGTYLFWPPKDQVNKSARLMTTKI